MDQWSKIGYDSQNTSYAPEVSAPSLEASECWRFDLRDGLYTSPTVSDGTVYLNHWTEQFPQDPNVYALDSETGRTRWTLDLGSWGNKWASPTISNGAVFVLGDVVRSAALIALDSADGSERWRIEERFKHSAVVREGLLYSCRESGITAIDATDGQIVWDNRDMGRSGATPALYEERIFAPLGEGLWAFDAVTGEPRWQTATGTRQTSVGVGEELVFTGAKDGNLRAFEIGDGSVRWMDDGDEQIGKPPAVGKNNIFLGRDDGHLYSIAKETGKQNWVRRLDGWVREVSYIDGHLFVCSRTKGEGEHGVYILSPDDGTLRRKIEFERSPHAPVVAADGRFLVGTGKGLIALSD